MTKPFDSVSVLIVGKVVDMQSQRMQQWCLLSLVGIVLFTATQSIGGKEKGQSISATNEADEVQADVVDVELDDLALPFKRTDHFSKELIPAKIQALHGQRIRMRGHMHPTFAVTGIKKFLLNGETKKRAVHWAAGPEHSPVHHFILISLQERKPATYRRHAIVVEGTLRIEAVVLDGELWQLYHIDNATIAPTEPRRGFHACRGFGC